LDGAAAITASRLIKLPALALLVAAAVGCVVVVSSELRLPNRYNVVAPIAATATTAAAAMIRFLRVFVGALVDAAGVAEATCPADAVAVGADAP
jgi:hypothetical protein